MSGPHYMRAGDIALLLSISERTVRRWIASKELPSVKIGGARLVARAELQRLLSPDWNPIEDPDGEDK